MHNVVHDQMLIQLGKVAVRGQFPAINFKELL